MQLVISSFYDEPGYEFQISHKVDNFIRSRLFDIVFTKYSLDKIEPDKFMNLSVGTNSTIQEIQIKGPSIDKKNNFEVWGVWLPYKKIVDSSDPLSEYLRCFFDAVTIVFERFEIKEGDVRKVQEIVENEVIDNKDYAFIEIEKTPEIDVEKLLGKK